MPLTSVARSLTGWLGSASGDAADSGAAVHLPPVPVHRIESATERPARTLKHLIRLNHITNAVYFNRQIFHNHVPHLLGSAYMLGATGEQLNKLYESESKPLDRWVDSPSEITRDDWRDFLGKKEYQRAYVDFFEDEIYHKRYDWEAVVRQYLFEGRQPLFNELVSGVTHPLIHLGYAYELSHPDVAVEALTLATTSYGDRHKYLEDAHYADKPAPYTSRSVLEILQRMRDDPQFDGLFTHAGVSNLSALFSKHEDRLLDHWRAWDLAPTSDAGGAGASPDRRSLNAQFQQAFYASAALVAGSSTAFIGQGTGTERYHDFFIVHLLTSLHAVRVLLPIIPAEYHVPLLREWHLMTVALYVTQLRPRVDPDSIAKYPVNDRGWAWVQEQALAGAWAADAHFVKAVRAFKVGGETWPEDEAWYLRAALKFIDEFKGWAGHMDDKPVASAFSRTA
ncbi:hypothetical protein KEM52_000455 [Ascosphaera acerosa]|nr:hypothetical protein KEM52_000455 [Ascosphaera acerosa]